MEFMVKAFPVKLEISAVYSPWELLVRWWLDYNKHCQVLLGTYCKAIDKPIPSNRMTPCTHECIACINQKRTFNAVLNSTA